MKTWKIITAIILAVFAVALVATTAYGYMGGRFAGTQYGAYNGVSAPYGGYAGGMMGGGMMGGYAYSGIPQTTIPTQPSTPSATSPVTPYNGGGGCGGRRAWSGCAASGVYSTNVTYASQLNITTAVGIAQNYLTRIGNPDLSITQVEEYSLNFYVQISEKSTGIGAFEMLVDKYTGSIYPEMGPNMMWNTKYGMVSGGMMGAGGMMGGYGYGYTGTPTAVMPVNVTQAKDNAQQFLSTSYPGATIGDVTTFYGHYTLEVLSAGTPYGMLSVNGYTGQVWYHTWHGTFTQELAP
jgi:hypothetical protein